MTTQLLLRNGTRWQVGPGHNINLWTEPWLPNEDRDALGPISNCTRSRGPGNQVRDMDILRDIFSMRGIKI